MGGGEGGFIVLNVYSLIDEGVSVASAEISFLN